MKLDYSYHSNGWNTCAATLTSLVDSHRVALMKTRATTLLVTETKQKGWFRSLALKLISSKTKTSVLDERKASHTSEIDTIVKRPVNTKNSNLHNTSNDNVHSSTLPTTSASPLPFRPTQPVKDLDGTTGILVETTESSNDGYILVDNQEFLELELEPIQSSTITHITDTPDLTALYNEPDAKVDKKNPEDHNHLKLISESEGSNIQYVKPSEPLNNIVSISAPVRSRLPSDKLVCNEKELIAWSSRVIASGFCGPHDIDELVWQCHGIKSRFILHNHVRCNLESVGLLANVNDPYSNNLFDQKYLPLEPEDLAALLVSAIEQANRSQKNYLLNKFKQQEFDTYDTYSTCKKVALNAISSDRFYIEELVRWAGLKTARKMPATDATDDQFEHQSSRMFARTLSSLEQIVSLDSDINKHEVLLLLESIDTTVIFCEFLTLPFEIKKDYRRSPAVDDALHSLNGSFSRLLFANMPITEKIAKEYSDFGTDNFEDVLQVGTLSLMQSIWTFDPSFGKSLSIYAIARVRKAVAEYKDHHPTYEFRTDHEFKYQYGDISEDYMNYNESAIRKDELALPLDIDEMYWDEFPTRCPHIQLQTESEHQASEDGCVEFTLSGQRETVIVGLLKSLTEIEREILCRRFGIGFKSNQSISEISAHTKLTDTQVTKHLNMALKHLRDTLGPLDVSHYL